MKHFIRHADKESEDFNAPLSSAGRERAKLIARPDTELVLCSRLSRSIETASILFPEKEIHQIEMLNEYDKHRETEEQFIARVGKALEFLSAHKDAVIISHGRFMCVAYQLVTKRIVVGFDYLCGFSYE